MFNPNNLPSNTPRRNNQSRNRGGIFDQLRDRILDQNPMMLLFMGMSLLTLLIQSIPYVLAGAYTFLASSSVVLWAGLDFAFGSRLVSEVPALMWMFWGAIFGASAAFWLSAPLYGWRSKRALLILLPLLLMVVVGGVVSFTKPLPRQPNLLENVEPTPPTAATANASANNAAR